jgi:hypothetical protein
MALLGFDSTRAVEIELAVAQRRLHWVWRPGARDTACGADTFGKYIANARFNVTCPACVRVIGIAALVGRSGPPEST